MNFDHWWKSKWPATIDEAGFALLEEAWRTAFRDGYEKGAAAFHDAVAMEHEMCVKTCEACEDTGNDRGIERDVAVWNKAVAYCVRRLKERSNVM